MKIVHVITRLISGGADENTVLTCNMFAAAGQEVTLVYGREYDSDFVAKLDPRVRAVVIPSLRRELAPVDDLKALLALRQLFAAEKPDVIHTHTSKAGFLGRLASAAVPSALVVHGIHILPFIGVGRTSRIVYTALEKLAARFTHLYISVSEGMQDRAIETGLGEPDQHLVAPSGMDIEGFKALRAREPGEGTGPLTVVYLANYEPRKGHVPLLEAIARRREDLAGRVVFRFAGRGFNRDRCVAIARDKGLGDLVDVGSFCDDPIGLMGGADMGIYCSSNEGLPRAIVQYCAAGLPIVAMELPGIERIVADGKTGRLVRNGDFDELVDAVVDLAADRDKRLGMRREACRIDLSAWSVESMYRIIRDGYAGALRKMRAPAGHGGDVALHPVAGDRGTS